MDAFEQNKYNEDAYFKLMLSNSVIVSYGTITAIDFDSVEVTLAVSNRNFADKINCTFMNLGNDQFSISFKPAISMKVVVFSPHKGTNGMYDSFLQMKSKTGKNFISTGSPAVYSSQQSFCFPLMKSTSSALSSLLIDNGIMSLQMTHDLVGNIKGVVDLFINNDTTIELNEGTKHIRNTEGDLIETCGMVEGISGTEKQGTYLYEETYGKFSTVKKNYESGAEITIGKAYEKPFLDNKGALVDSSAPVTINLGSTAPVTLTFGDTAMTIALDSTDGIDITLTGTAKVSLVTAAGKFKIGNDTATLKVILDKIADLFTNMTTIGPNVVPGAPYTAAATPATATLAAEIKTLAAGLFE